VSRRNVPRHGRSSPGRLPWDRRWHTMASVASNPRVFVADRELVVEQLKRAYVEGRIDDVEFDLRVGLALTVTTRRELESLVSDLPRPGASAGGGHLARKFQFTVLIVMFATAGTAAITYWLAVLIAAGMSLHLIK